MSAENHDMKLVPSISESIVETTKVILKQDIDNTNTIYTARRIAAKAGFKLTDEIMIATAASELSTNILRYAGSGEIIISIIKNKENGLIGIEIYAWDEGPGIYDIELAMQEQYSSLTNSLGLGLPSVKRIMDEFFIESIYGKGTRILARKWNKNGKTR